MLALKGCQKSIRSLNWPPIDTYTKSQWQERKQTDTQYDKTNIYTIFNLESIACKSHNFLCCVYVCEHIQAGLDLAWSVCLSV